MAVLEHAATAVPFLAGPLLTAPLMTGSALAGLGVGAVVGVAVGAAAGAALRLGVARRRQRACLTELDDLRAQVAERDVLLEMAGEVGRFGGWAADTSTGQTTWSPEVARLHGEPVGFSPTVERGISYYLPEDRPVIREAFERCATQGEPFDVELRLERTDGTRIWVASRGRAVRDEHGAIVQVQGSFQDISARKLAEQSAEESHRRLQMLANSLPIVVWTATGLGEIDYLNRVLVDYTGRPRESLLGANWLQVIHPDDVEECVARWRESVSTGTPYRTSFRIRRHDGSYRTHVVSASREPLDDEGGTTWWGAAIDVEDQLRLQEEASAFAERLERTLDSITDGVFTLDPQWRFTFVSRTAGQLLHREPAGMVGRSLWEEFAEARGSISEVEYRRAVETGQTRRFEDYFAPLQAWFQANACPDEHGLTVYFRDITEERRLSEQLERAQRLESLGQLTGGVAHDFNNLLTVIMGNAETLTRELAHAPQHLTRAEMILTVCERASELTHSLLAFARRQPLAPVPTDVNALIRDMEVLLERTLSEDIEVVRDLDASVPAALVDPAQLESSLLNLCINARDAMPEGGRLVLETRGVHLDETYVRGIDDLASDDYVVITVTDTGRGIDPADHARLFEPFFTTKGQGSGLGLPMVYGFAKQSQGHVSIYSELGQGTRVHLYLPQSPATPVSPPAPRRDVPRAVPGETVLLVEDDEQVRRSVVERLSALGYLVLDAATGPNALAVLASDTRVDLLLTDVVMPGGMSGRQVAITARELRPGLPVLYTSGYTESAIVHGGKLDPGVRLLQKPHNQSELAQKVRASIDETTAPAR